MQAWRGRHLQIQKILWHALSACTMARANVTPGLGPVMPVAADSTSSGASLRCCTTHDAGLNPQQALVSVLVKHMHAAAESHLLYLPPGNDVRTIEISPGLSGAWARHLQPNTSQCLMLSFSLAPKWLHTPAGLRASGRLR